MEQTYKKNISEFDEKFPNTKNMNLDISVYNIPTKTFSTHRNKLKDFLTSAHINMIDALVKEISEDNKWATQGESDDEKWKIHYGGYKEGVKNVITYLEGEKQKILNQTK